MGNSQNLKSIQDYTLMLRLRIGVLLEDFNGEIQAKQVMQVDYQLKLPILLKYPNNNEYIFA